MTSSRCSPAETTALILAGGRATRLGGVDKRELVVEGRTIFARQCEVLAPRVAEILVSSPREIPGYRTVADTVPGAGPLAGIAAGLAAAATPWLLVVAGDMPYVSGALIELLRSHAGDGVDAVGIRIGELPEPLVCMLRVAAARPVVAARLAAARLKASRLLTDGELHVAWIAEPALRAIDPTLRALFNVNEPGDLRPSRP
ncbi:MAG TPA: molybdenum cofactor guanylyltransferase [Kofleriaceae bacterium]|nr:molybdenum cofactor guanylyltransferase [Kofleriaceae bacterium]